MDKAEITKTQNLNYKNGFVQCACGWRKVLGDGFDGYYIANCPDCTKELRTRLQSQVTTGKSGNYKIEYGRFIYFVISNGCHIQFSKSVYHTEYKSRIK